LLGLGLRCTPKEVHYVVLQKIDEVTSLVANDRLVAPASAELAIQIGYVADSVAAIAGRYEVEAIGIKLTEPFGLKQRGTGQSELTRIYFEGSIQAEMARSGKVCLSALSNQIRAILKSRSPKEYILRNEFRNLAEFASLSKEQKEAAMVAEAALVELERRR
jgi:hypothetical protein